MQYKEQNSVENGGNLYDKTSHFLQEIAYIELNNYYLVALLQFVFFFYIKLSQ